MGTSEVWMQGMLGYIAPVARIVNDFREFFQGW